MKDVLPLLEAPIRNDVLLLILIISLVEDVVMFIH